MIFVICYNLLFFSGLSTEGVILYTNIAYFLLKCQRWLIFLYGVSDAGCTSINVLVRFDADTQVIIRYCTSILQAIKDCLYAIIKVIHVALLVYMDMQFERATYALISVRYTLHQKVTFILPNLIALD